MVHTVGSSPADPTCRRAWVSLHVSGRAACVAAGFVHVGALGKGVTSCVGEARTEMLVLHLPAPALPWGCACRSSSHVAIPGRWIALCEYSAFQSHRPSGMLRDCNSLWNKAWPAHLYMKHLHIQVILSMLFASSKLQAQSSEPRAFLKKLVWRPAGTICALSSPQQLPVGQEDRCRAGCTAFAGKLPCLWLGPQRSLCGSQGGAAVGGHSSLLAWRGAQVRSKGTASLKGFTTANESYLFGDIGPSC